MGRFRTKCPEISKSEQCVATEDVTNLIRPRYKRGRVEIAAICSLIQSARFILYAIVTLFSGMKTYNISFGVKKNGNKAEFTNIHF